MSVVGMADTSKSPALGYMHIVDNKDANRLLSIISQGITVYSDKW